MLRAMWLSLKAHAEAHPDEPFDHERDMPGCMKTAREDPATWAGDGGGSDGDPNHVRVLVPRTVGAPVPELSNASAIRRRSVRLPRQAVRVEALQRMWPNGRAHAPKHRYFRHEVFELIGNREPAIWKLWPNVKDRETALKCGKQGNIRPDHPFMIAWDAAFREVFGHEVAGDAAGSGVKDTWNIFVRINKNPPTQERPNGWWTRELDVPAA